MANATVALPCRFRWEIFNPFLPLRKLEATFSHASPTVTQWKVILQHVNRYKNHWEFMISLEFDRWFDDRVEVVADDLQVFVNLNRQLVTRKKIEHYCFSQGNRYIYCFQEETPIRPQMDPHHFVIEIQFSLSSNGAENEAVNGLIYSEDDVRCLSRDLRLLLNDRRYSNMELLSRNNSLPITAHSYIIEARWDNFFKLHAFQLDRNRVETNISCPLLNDILIYMYSGTLGMSWPDWTNAAYITELFKVIYRYKLHHMYKIFVKNDLHQIRVTRNHGFIESCLFPFDDIENRRKNNSSYTWYVNPNPENAFIFQISVGESSYETSEGRPCLIYSLQSMSSSRVYASVYLEMIKKVAGEFLRTTWPLHERDYTIDVNETADSGKVIFLGCPEEFGDINSIPSDGTGDQCFIRCFLSVTNRSTVNQVRSDEDDRALQNDLEGINVLSDHMHRLNHREMEAEVSIQSSAPDPDEDENYDIHMGIMAIRIPYIWAGFDDVYPPLVTSILSSAALPFVIDYIYTGKVFSIPQPLWQEIEEFARRTACCSLLDLISRFRSGTIN